MNGTYITTNKDDILKSEEHDFIAELTDDASASFEIVRTALSNGNSVVSANKKMIAENLKELIELQNHSGTNLLYDAACAGSIPIIRILDDHYQNENVISIKGILNGTSNYILSNMNFNNLTFGEALLKAQKSGIAESDPSLDISGKDTNYKNTILSVHSHGALLNPETSLTLGIESINKSDIEFAKNINSKIKLVSYIYEKEDVFTSFVTPAFVNRDHNFFDVEYENNSLEIEGEFTSGQVYTGKGAGSYPTGIAVLSDIAALTKGYRYNYLKLNKKENAANDFTTPNYDYDIKVYVRYNDQSDISGFGIHSIIQENKTTGNKYVIGYCSLNALNKLSAADRRKIFICAFDPLKDIEEKQRLNSKL
jgi:homoserine dehydrogenase